MDSQADDIVQTKTNKISRNWKGWANMLAGISYYFVNIPDFCDLRIVWGDFLHDWNDHALCYELLWHIRQECAICDSHIFRCAGIYDGSWRMDGQKSQSALDPLYRRLVGTNLFLV